MTLWEMTIRRPGRGLYPVTPGVQGEHGVAISVAQAWCLAEEKSMEMPEAPSFYRDIFCPVMDDARITVCRDPAEDGADLHSDPDLVG